MLDESDPLGAALQVLRLVTENPQPPEQRQREDAAFRQSLQRSLSAPDAAGAQLRDSVFHVLRFLEGALALAQGKGWGTATIGHEVGCMLAALGGRTPQLAVDIGGNVGEYSAELLARVPGLDLHIFEPAAVNVARLRERFGGQPAVRINAAAVAAQDGSAVLYGDAPGSGLASLSRRRLDHRGITFDCSEPVQTLRFERYWQQVLGGRTIDLLKLDIEGHELEALQGMGPALAATRVLQFEFGGCNIDTRSFLQDFFYFFEAAGFALHRITPLGLEALPAYREIDEFFSTTNFIVVNQRLG